MYQNKHEAKVQNFIHKSLSDAKENDLSLHLYKDLQFCIDLQMQALQHIKQILACMQMEKLKAADQKDTNCSHLLDLPHPETQAKLLDYCLLAGFDVLGENLASLGCSTTKASNRFITQLAEYYPNENKPGLVKKILQTAAKIEAGQNTQVIEQAVPAKSYWQTIMDTVRGWNKYSILAVIIGVVCLSCAPLAGAYSGILIAIGLPTILAKLGSLLRPAKAEPAAKTPLELFESKDLEQFMDEANQQLQALKARRNLLKDPYIASYNTLPILKRHSQEMLFSGAGSTTLDQPVTPRLKLQRALSM